MLPLRTRVLASLRSWLPIVSSGATVSGGVVKQNAEAVGSTVQANGGLALALVGLVGMAIHFLDRYANPWFADRREERSLREKQLRLAEIEEQARMADLRARDAAVLLVATEARAVKAEARLRELEVQVPANTAAVAGVQGVMDGALDILDDLARQGVITLPVRPNRSRTRATILVVEDNPETAHLLMRLFTHQGFSPSHSPTVKDAMEKVNLFPSWVILDLKVGADNGLDLLRKVRTESLPVAVAILTATEDRNLIKAAQALKPDRFFKKPVNFNELISAITPGSGPRDPVGPGPAPEPSP
jgi:ActR/RegA family two-component response regulator